MEPARKLNLDAMSSPKMSSISSWNEEKLEFIEVQDNEDFKTKICMPYFKDIFKDLQSRSDDEAKGINKVSLLEYAHLPGVLGERFFSVMDTDNNNYLDQREFFTGLLRIFCSNFDQKTAFVFEIYDFDNDGFISKNDISIIMSSLPVINFDDQRKNHEGMFTQEGGGLDNFQQRVETLDEISKILDVCFQGKQRIDLQQFKQINEDISSDTVLAVLGLFRERLPCSENFWRYKRNYDLHIKNNESMMSQSEDARSAGGNTITKRIASPKMRHVRALSPYSRAAMAGTGNESTYASKALGPRVDFNDAAGDKQMDFQQKLERIKSLQQRNKQEAAAYTPQQPIEQPINTAISGQVAKPGAEEEMDDVNMNEEFVTSKIPISHFQSNNVAKKQRYIEPLNLQKLGGGGQENLSEQPMSPGAQFAMRDVSFKRVANQAYMAAIAGGSLNMMDQLSPRSDGGSSLAHCVCGLPMRMDQETCDTCEGKNSIHIDGYIIKKQKKEGQLRKYWYVLLGKELYSYKTQGDPKHKDMQSLAGVYIKSQAEEQMEDGTILHPFMLIFSNKRRIYYLDSKEDRDNWVEKIKQAIGYANLHDFYDLENSLGKGKYGIVKKGRHKKSGREVAVKIVKKKELSLKDIELLKREIEVLKICQHPNIIRFYDVFENSDYIYIVMEYLQGGDFFNYLEHQNFKIPESRAKAIAHQIATAIFYLHSFGIAHRDLKPENILMVNDTFESPVKLVDFGLSKTFGPNETCNEPFGTLCYVAPEILSQKPYDKSVDCWSFGIITYLMLSRHLPFDSNDDKEIGRKTIYQQISFTHSVWDNVSNEAKDLVYKLLQKDRLQRMSIKDALDHPWLNNADPTMTQMRKEANKGNDEMMKFISYSNVDVKIAQEASKRSNSPPQMLMGGPSSPVGSVGSANMPSIDMLNLNAAAHHKEKKQMNDSDDANMQME